MSQRMVCLVQEVVFLITLRIRFYCLYMQYFATNVRKKVNDIEEGKNVFLKERLTDRC